MLLLDEAGDAFERADEEDEAEYEDVGTDACKELLTTWLFILVDKGDDEQDDGDGVNKEDMLDEL